MPLLLQLGDLKVCLYACTPSATKLLDQFWDVWATTIFHIPHSCEPEWHLAIVSPHIPDEQSYPTWLSESERQISAQVHKRWMAVYQFLYDHQSSPQSQKTEGEGPGSSLWPKLWLDGKGETSFRGAPGKSGHFFCLASDESEEWFVAAVSLQCMFLASWWHALRGSLCLHSAAVARGLDGFLFLGISGAGKTTVAQLSASAEYTVLGDDFNSVIRDGEHGYTLAAMPGVRPFQGRYSALRPLLRGIFVLVQDNSDYLVPMLPIQVTQILYDGLGQAFAGRKLPDDATTAAFHTIGQVARQTPGYELHFRKCADFWKLIDERFPSPSKSGH